MFLKSALYVSNLKNLFLIVLLQAFVLSVGTVFADSTYVFKGKVKNYSTNNSVVAQIWVTVLGNDEHIESIRFETKNDGSFEIPDLRTKKDYVFQVRAKGYYANIDTMRALAPVVFVSLESNFVLKPLKSGKVEIFQGVTFESGTAEIAENSISVMNELIHTMQVNKSMKVVINGCTDCSRADHICHCHVLQKKRVKTVMKNLEEAGIPRRRIKQGNYNLCTNLVTENQEGLHNKRLDFIVLAK